MMLDAAASRSVRGVTAESDETAVASAAAQRSSEASAAPGADDARQRRVELLAIILLAVAAVAVAFSTYRSTWWRGEQAQEASRATAGHIASAQASTRAGQHTEIDVVTFGEWVDAYASGNTELADFYQQRFRNEFRPAFDAWIATNPRTNPDAPHTPFEMPQYQLADAKEAQRLDAAAVASSRDAAKSIERSDDYMLAVVLFATSLFFAGISSKFRSARQREVLLAIGTVVFVGAAAWVVSLAVLDRV
jgi:hypothetical protein